MNDVKFSSSSCRASFLNPFPPEIENRQMPLILTNSEQLIQFSPSIHPAAL